MENVDNKSIMLMTVLISIQYAAVTKAFHMKLHMVRGSFDACRWCFSWPNPHLLAISPEPQTPQNRKK